MPRSSSRSYIRRGNIAVARSSTFSLGDDQKPSRPTRLRRRSASDIFSALGIRELATANPSTAASPAIFLNCSRITGRYSSQWPSASTTGWFKRAWSSRAVMDETSSFGDEISWVPVAGNDRTACRAPSSVAGVALLRRASGHAGQLGTSEGQLASLGRALPLAAGVVVEDQRLIGGHHDPEAAIDFCLELAGRPAGVSRREQDAARAGAMGERVEHLRIARDRDPVLDWLAVHRHPLPRMQDESASGFDGAAVVDTKLAAHAFMLAPERFEDARERHGGDGAIHDEAQRAGGVVPEHVDDGVREAWIAES